ncbi:MAG TPA: hypothetical protein VKF17_00765 [Isosphaeraceae bacterium]|nr:hypothetical protein [Isosphaeraceae bacterium]
MGVLESEPSARGGTVLAGYHGRYVRVDAATGTSSSEALAPEILRGFVGGVGLGTWIVAVEVAKRVVNARKCLNQREGWTACEDTLPSRLLTESPPQPGASILSRARLQR